MFQSIFCAACALTLLVIGQGFSRADASTNSNILVTLSDPLMSLSAPAWSNGQMQFDLNGESNVSYVIESSPDAMNWTPIATNLATPSITVATPTNAGFYRASRNPLPLFTYAVAAGGYIDLNGRNLVTDSFNSSDTNLSTGGYYDATKTSTNGNAGSGSGFLYPGNLTIHGNLYVGPTASYTNQLVSGTIYSNYNFHFPDVMLPARNTNGNSIDWVPAPSMGGTNVFVVTAYYYVNNSNPIYVAPGVTSIVNVATSKFNPTSITIGGGMTNSGTLVIYQDSGIATIGGNSIGGAIGNRPRNFIYFGLPGVTNITLSGASTFIGTIYAPKATLVLNGGGATNNLEGSAIVNKVMSNGFYSFHYDEGLLMSGPVR